MQLKVKYDDMVDVFKKILLKKGFDEQTSQLSATLFAQNSLDGVYSHGVNRFPRVLSYIDKGYIKVDAKPEKVSSLGAIEKWDGKLAMGNSNAYLAMQRAIELSQEYGIGVVALGNTNHWMRGGAYGWQAANAGKIGICWTNTMPNMPAWGTKQRNIGNNPFILSIPRQDQRHIVIDCAMAQFSYGKIEEAKLKGQKLPVVGGFNTDLQLTDDPEQIEKSWLVLPIGFWKGSGLSIVLDLIASVLSGGNSVTQIGKNCEDEYGLSQILISIDPDKFTSCNLKDEKINEVIDAIKSSEKMKKEQQIFYPGEIEFNTRKQNLENGIPVIKQIWDDILLELEK